MHFVSKLLLMHNELNNFNGEKNEKKEYLFFGIILGSFLIVSCGSNMETSATEDFSNPEPYY